MLRDAVISASNNINKQKRMVDELNVFPVPDGDTGTNMSMTISSAARELRKLDNAPLSEVAAATASALLRGARGNSGVILSLLFRGFSKGLQGLQEAGAAELAGALQMGVEAAYKAVMKPTEGTMLTVARVAAERARAVAAMEVSPVELWQAVCETAAEALSRTPEQLPVLKKAGVVDAGGKGLCLIYEGMLSVFRDGQVVVFDDGKSEPAAAPAAVGGPRFDEEILFNYCTEFIVNRTEPEQSPLALRAYLESIGDSVVVVDDEQIIKCHVHTNEPGNALQEALKFGFLTKMKIENMVEQVAARNAEAQERPSTYQAPDPTMPVGFVAVAAGVGVQQLFADLGVTHIVSGGQTMNPSTDDILEAIQSTPSETVIVLPNNKNIIMAAEQAVPLADRRVIVLPTRHIPQGMTAMLAYDPDLSVEDNVVSMTAAIKKVGSGHVTYASRDADFDGHRISKGEILALEGSRLSFTERDVNRAAMRLIRQLLKKDSCFITVLYGKDVDRSKAEELELELADKYPNLDFNVISGGQPVYHYIVSVE